MIYNIKEIIPIYGKDKNVLLMKSGSIAIGFKLELPEIFTLHEKQYNEIISNLGKNLYALIPENTVIQFQYIYKTKKNNSDYLKDKTFLEKSTKKHFKNRKYLNQDLFVYFILPEIASYKSSYSSFVIKSKKKNVDFKISTITDFYEKINKATDTLSSYDYFSFKELTEEETEQNIKDYFNFSSNSYSDLIREKSKLTYGEKEIKIYSLSDIDSLKDGDNKTVKIDNERSTDMSKFFRPITNSFGLEFSQDHIVNLVIYYDNQINWKSKLENQTKQLIGARLLSAKNEKNAEINQEFLNDVEDHNKKIVRFHYSIMVWDDNKEHLKKKTDYIESSFNKIGVKPYEVKYDLFFYLIGLFPGNADRLPQQETVLTYDEYPFLFFNPETNYKRDNQGFVFNDRLSQLPVMVDVFDTPYKTKLIDNRNFVVIAPTGGGKSFLLKHVLRQFIEEENTKTVVINIGGDDKIAKTYKNDSSYIVYKEGKSLNVNPFYIENQILTAEKIEFLIDFIEILWKNGQEMNNDERSTVEILIIEYYNAVPRNQSGFKINKEEALMNIKGFFTYIENTNETKSKEYALINLKSLLLNLKKFAVGSYSNLFMSGKPENNENKRYVEFELDNIKDHKILFPIFGMLISDLTFNTMWKTDGTKKMFFIDEAWKILEKPGMASLLKYLYKTIRKFTGAVGIAVQQITDIPDDAMGSAIIGNTAVKYLLNHSNNMNVVPVLKDRLSLSEQQTSMLLSLRNKIKGKFPHTEFLLILGNYAKVLRLEVSKEELVIAESDKEKLDKFNKLYEKHNEIEPTVREYIKLYS